MNWQSVFGLITCGTLSTFMWLYLLMNASFMHPESTLVVRRKITLLTIVFGSFIMVPLLMSFQHVRLKSCETAEFTLDVICLIMNLSFVI